MPTLFSAETAEWLRSLRHWVLEINKYRAWNCRDLCWGVETSQNSVYAVLVPSRGFGLSHGTLSLDFVVFLRRQVS